MKIIDSESERPNEFPQVLRVRTHTFRADVAADSGGHDTAPGPHDLFDAALIACKTLTATWYARKHGIALESVEGHVERDDSQERAGRYRLNVRLAYHGALSDADRERIHAAVMRCPIHKLMTSTEVEIETAPLSLSAPVAG